MPNTKSASKRLRQNKVRQERNKSIKSNVKTQVKKVMAAVEAGNVEEAEKEFKEAAKKLDRAGAKKIMHPNKASRKKSSLQHAIKKAKSASA